MSGLLAEAAAYAAFVLAAVALPGVAVLRLCRVAVDAALVIPVGLVVCAAAYGTSLAAGLPWLFPAVALGLSAAAVWPRRRPFTLAPGPSLRGALPPFLAVVALLSLTRYPWNRIDAHGDFQGDPIYVADTTFHVGLTWELAHGYPPQVPGFAGVSFAYHFGAALVRAAALVWAGIHPYSSLSRFEPTLGALALVLAWRGLAHALKLDGAAVRLAPWGLIASDASFWLALFPGREFWVEDLKGSLLTSLVLANSTVPALALVAGCLIAFSRYLEDRARGWLVLAGLCAVAVPFFKVFSASLLVAGLVAAAWRSPSSRPAAGLLAGLSSLVVLILAFAQRTRTVDVLLDPLTFVHATAREVGLEPLAPAALGLFALFWLASSIGLRLIGLPSAARALLRGPAPAAALGAIALLGWPLGLLVRISLRDDAGFNEAFYFIEQSGAVLWIFTAQALGAAVRRGVSTPVVAIVAALLAFPSTAEFVYRKMETPADVVPAGVLRGMEALRRDTAPGAIVLQRPHTPHGAPPVVFAGRRVPYTRVIPYFAQFMQGDVAQARLDEVRRFFQTDSGDEALAIARRLGATHLCLYGGEGVGFEIEGNLELLFEDPAVHVYRIEDR